MRAVLEAAPKADWWLRRIIPEGTSSDRSWHTRAECQTRKHVMGERVLYTILFSTGSDRDVAADDEQIRKLAGEYFAGFSLFSGKGYWQRREELSFQLLVATEEEASVRSLVEKIKAAFAQDSVIQITHNSASVSFNDAPC